VLVVDDAPFVREIVRSILANTRFEVVGEARDGVEAVGLALQLRPDIILMDMIMPHKSGLEATREILAKWPQARIVAFTTAERDVMEEKARQAGCTGFLAKPFEAKQLMSVLGEPK
jgi:two-component system chemotaxis response regulator CheY